MKASTKKKGRIGSSFDDFLKEDGIYEGVTARAIKRVLARQLSELMRREEISKTELASRMKTSRAQLDRLLDPENESVTLGTLARAARAVGRQALQPFAYRLATGRQGIKESRQSLHWLANVSILVRKGKTSQV